MRPRTRFLISAGVTFGLMSLTLWLLGPVWILDLEDNPFVFLVAMLFLLALLCCLGGEAASPGADFAAAVVEGTIRGTIAGGRLLRWMTGRFWPAVLGFLGGGLLAVGAAWGLSQTEGARMTYARARPVRALAWDFVAVAPVLDKYKKAHKKPPEDMAQLVGALRQDGFSPRFSMLRGDQWVDAWGNPLRYRAKKRLIGWSTELYSIGPDGLDNEGVGDDLSAAGIFTKWKVLQFLTASPKEDKK